MLPEGSVNLPPQSKTKNHHHQQQQQQQQQHKSEVNEGCELRDYRQYQNKEKARLFHSFVLVFQTSFFFNLYFCFCLAYSLQDC